MGFSNSKVKSQKSKVMSVGSMQIVITSHYRKSGDLLPFAA
jgi:hypothetical protein